MIYLQKDFLLIVGVFLLIWSAMGVAAEFLWCFYWATLRDVYPSLPAISKSLFVKNILRASIVGPLNVIIVLYFIAEERKLVRKDSDDQGGRMVYRDLIPDPPPTPKNTKPALH